MSGVVHNVSSIRNFTTKDHTDASIDVVDSSVSFLYEEFGEDQSFGSKDDSIFAFNSDNGSWLINKVLSSLNGLGSVLDLKDTSFLGISDTVLIELTHIWDLNI